MARAASDTDVLIVGAGPVGLFLANECARRGLRSRIIEAKAPQSIHSKALAIFPRMLEILDMAGVVTPFLEKANRVTSVTVIGHDRRLGHMAFTPEESPYPFIAMIPQDMTERLLVQHLENAGGAKSKAAVLQLAKSLSDIVELRFGNRSDTAWCVRTATLLIPRVIAPEPH